MGSVDIGFARDLRDSVGLERAVETGTFRGVTARKLASLFPNVVTIELSEALHQKAVEALADVSQIQALQGHSVRRLLEVADGDRPTLYFLDGHWSGGATEGADDQCPALEELEAIGGGHPEDCFIIDDARLFTSAPPPPHNTEQWPTIVEVFDALRERHPDHVVTVLNDQVIAAPRRAKPAIDRYGLRTQPRPGPRDHWFGIRNWLKQTAVVTARQLRRGRTAS